MDYEKAIDSIEHDAIFKALRSIGLQKCSILGDIYTCAAARVQMDNQVSEETPMPRGVRQGNPISPKLFTATIQEVFKNAQLEEQGINNY